MRSVVGRLGRAGLSDGALRHAWDDYCGRHPAATPFHLTAWSRVAADALDHAPRCLYVERAGAIAGVLPLFLRRSRIFGRTLVSTPAGTVGEPLADDDDGALQLVEAAIAIAREERVAFYECRGVVPGTAAARPLALDEGRYASFVVDLAGGEGAAWSRLRKSLRRDVRRARDAGLTFELGADLRAFYPVYAASVKRLGSPPFSRRFFACLRDELGDLVQVGLARLRGGRAVAVDLLVTYRDVRYSLFAGSHAEAWHLHPNQFLLWEEIAEACARGLRAFDLGRSPLGSGALEFKQGWGGRSLPLTYGYHLERSRSVPTRTPEAPLYRALGAIWSRLPSPLVETVGPRLVRHLF
jgi:FemAB-related protein (PEP-CTERM system-associated)